MVQLSKSTALFFTSAAIFLVGCNLSSPVPTKEVKLFGVTFVIPASYKIEESREEGTMAFFQFEGLPGEIREGRFSVLGKDYGLITSGDIVTFHPDGTFIINGEKRESTGLAENAIQSQGVTFMIQGGVQNKRVISEDKVNFEDQEGREFTIENGSVTMNGFTHGPYGDGWAVKVSHDATITDLYP